MRTALDIKIIIGRKIYDELKICSIEIAYTSNSSNHGYLKRMNRGAHHERIRNDQKASISDKQYELDGIALPTLILHALDDRLVDCDFAKYAHAHLPNSKPVAFPSGGHLLLGQDKQYRKAVIGLLKEHL